ncbi:hypothetical protein SAMN04488037_101116 [Shimia marina]|uniref:Uncharacterized protein n=1 Tax=Shimia marina TaxID=321267 RepID=A0A0P1FAZ2_9RHOB|nr:hypothetical protein SHM7688_00990 [Shimia marina]SFD46200.1 hypothetical protein SAMN04488037_101116 [Shimia marina]
MGIFDMLKTITVGSCVSIQGPVVKNLPDGRVSIRVGDKVYSGKPIS